MTCIIERAQLARLRRGVWIHSNGADVGASCLIHPPLIPNSSVKAAQQNSAAMTAPPSPPPHPQQPPPVRIRRPIGLIWLDLVEAKLNRMLQLAFTPVSCWGGFWQGSEPSRHLLTAGMLAQTRGTVPEPPLVALLSAAP